MENKNLNKLYSSLVKAQSEFGIVEFDMVNGHFKNKYASLASIRNATAEALAKHGFGIIQPWEYRDNGDIVLHTKLIHESGEELVSSVLIPRGAKRDQEVGSSLTYHRRYQLASMLGVSPEEDDDAEVSHGNSYQSSNLPKKQHTPKPASSSEAFDTLAKSLETDGISSIGLKSWVKERSALKKCSEDEVISSCLSALPSFKKSYADWLSKSSQMAS